MKKILSLAAVAAMAVTANASELDDAKYFENWGKLKLVGNQLSSSKTGEAVQLKGWSTFGLHFKDVRNCLSKDHFALMKHYGANMVRLAMYIDDTYDGGSYIGNESTYKQAIKDYIKACYSLNMYALVDWHTLDTNGHEGNPANQTAISKDFFAEISKYCKDNGYDNVLYELCNEPNTDSWATIKGYAESVIPEILNNQPEAMIVVGTNFYCQKVMEPVSNPISKYKNNVLYSFHYYACTHYSLLSQFRAAQGSIPMFVSEWSGVAADGNGNFCRQNADDLMRDCGITNDAKQLVSWAIWNWGSKNETSSFFHGSCDEQHISDSRSDDGTVTFGEFVSGLMSGGRKIEARELPTSGPYTDINVIPSTPSKAFRWDAYNLGGEGVAYHDGNGGAWAKDKEGKVTGYQVGKNEEVDVFSLAVEQQWLTEKFPYSTVVDGKVTKWDPQINTDWKDGETKQPTYRSLNGGRMYSGTDGSRRPDEGVDISGASCNGTAYAGKGYQNLGWVEEDEWIKFTVDVEKPGYYKIQAVVGAEYTSPAKNGEISITSTHGNHLRSSDDFKDETLVNTFGFPATDECADKSASPAEPWNCWAMADAISGRHEVYVAFPAAGEQEITFTFLDNAGGVGPLVFTYEGPLLDGDPITAVVEPEAEEVFSIYPNPTSGEFTVALADQAEATVEIVNMAGQVVASQVVEGSATINKALAAGVYTVVVKSNGNVSTQKLIVK